MRLRRLVASAASVAILTAVVAAPVSAGGPASWKVGTRLVGYGFSGAHTNCPPAPALLSAMKTAGTTGKVIPGQLPQYPCGRQEIKSGQDYYEISVMTVGAVLFGQAGSGYSFTGLGSNPPMTGVVYTAWLWNGGGWDLLEGVDFVPSDYLVVAEDLALGVSSTWIPGLGRFDVSCAGYGAWGREAITSTGGIDPNQGWTRDQSWRTRFCVPVATIAGTPLPYGIAWIYRRLFTTVNVYPF